ncbi:MAG TPA: glycosyl hydrolase family 28-related protein, partial [Alphaproteobacteria bacterium]|nr:glycosyl hydrolase family 28-related protein [Alphaproteobacteria bacterium]
MAEHIKMPDVAPLVRYLANGVQTVFEYPFPVFASEDMHVLFDGAEQISGFTISGAGNSAGGSVTFDTAPVNGVIVTLERRMAFERLTDFIEGGDFAASAINTELDYLVAGLQQISRDQAPMLKYDDGEEPSVTSLPTRSIRAGKALGFDGNGDPVAVSLAGAMAAPDFTAVGVGAQTRSSSDKFSDMISVKDFGAVGDGLTDDTLAFQQALTAHSAVFVPAGVYIVSSTIAIGQGQSLIGVGDSSEIKTSSSIPLIQFTGSYGLLKNIKLFGGDVGIKFLGISNPCVQNAVVDVSTWQAQTGVLLDGGSDGLKPTYWNNFTRVLVAQPFVHGIHLMRSGAG